MQDNENAVVVYPCSRLSGEIRLQGSKTFGASPLTVRVLSS